MPLPSGRTRATVEWALLVLLLAVFVRSGFIPGWRVFNTDFPNYYLVASLFRQGVPLDRVYEWQWLQRQKDHLGIPEAVAGFIPYPAISALPVLPLTTLPPLQAKRAWLVVNLGFLGLAIYLMQRATLLPARMVALLAMSCILPLRVNFWLGQYYVLLLLLLASAYYASRLEWRVTSGVLLAFAAALKIFPGLFLLLFIWKRDWRSALGLVGGLAALFVFSVALFGLPVHLVYFAEVLPRTLSGDVIGPYFLQWNSFSSLWHRLFLFEPQLNPSPLANVPLLYSFAQAATMAFLFASFCWFTRKEPKGTTAPAEWAAFPILLILVSPMPAIYHLCVLIVSVIIGFDVLQREKRPVALGMFIAMFVVVCFPLPGRIVAAVPLIRLAATLALYACFAAWAFREASQIRLQLKWVAVTAVAIALLMPFYWHSVRGRDEDFHVRIAHQPDAYRSDDPIAGGDRTFFLSNAMYSDGYGVASLKNAEVEKIPLDGDALVLRGSADAPSLYVEVAGRRSRIARWSSSTMALDARFDVDGEEPAISPNGSWLAFIQSKQQKHSLWLQNVAAPDTGREILRDARDVLETAVTAKGDVVVAIGKANAPNLAMVDRETASVAPLAVPGAVRFPAFSPSGARLAFSRRELGSWHLFVRENTTGAEQQLTGGSCNASSPSWKGETTILYATDCGRGLGLTALAQVEVKP